MQSFPVIKHLDVLEQCYNEFISGCPSLTVGEFAFDSGPQTLSDRVDAPIFVKRSPVMFRWRFQGLLGAGVAGTLLVRDIA
jgi:hypothetical protein